MNKKEAYEELINICKSINNLLNKGYIAIDKDDIWVKDRFYFEKGGIYRKEQKDGGGTFYLLGENHGSCTYGYKSYLHEIQRAKKEILKLKFIHPKNVSSAKSLINSLWKIVT